MQWTDPEIALAAAREGAAVALEYFGRVRALPVASKADGSLVTEADLTVESTIKQALARARPDDAFLGEETGSSGTGHRRWILVQDSPWHCHGALLVAAGELDLAVQIGGRPWDYAALALIVHEAGGQVAGSSTPGHPMSGTVAFASGDRLLRETLTLLP
ncbi:inositol monophosphatase [Cellulomonas sp. 179-A 4D5 NHS]|uniref:inositol monophosphatase family protein n=1 Tax=Cellulomonas sp. 179-A 4D5 NHS TaxID=3142378 RepID=UPI0039A1CFC7